MMPNTCCCGFSLQTGTKIIASLAIVSSSISICYYLWISIATSGFLGIDYVGSSIAYLISAVLLLRASLLEIKPFYIFPWLSVTALTIFITPFVFIQKILIHDDPGSLGITLGVLLGVGIPSLALSIYFCLVVYSFYKNFEPTEMLPLITQSDI